MTDLDKLIKAQHGDVKKLRQIRDTIKHDNFITTDDKNYVQSLIDEYQSQSSERLSPRKQSDTRIKLQAKSKTDDLGSQSNFSFNFSSNKKVGILAGAAAAIAIIVIVGFPASDTVNSSLISTSNNPLLVTVDQTQYQRADIILISGDTTAHNQTVGLSIENTNGVKIWKESIDVSPNSGNFSTMVIAGGGGWENGGSYTVKAYTSTGLTQEIQFRFMV